MVIITYSYFFLNDGNHFTRARDARKTLYAGWDT